ncbi:MAG: pilus assembly protein [Chloroflexi bacterium]|nr:pilus assembly protein [Chloroflexota bacterium]
MTGRRQDSRGQALTEFALVAPILFLLLFGVLELGLLFGAHNGLVAGVRETARRAATYRVNDASFLDPSAQAFICGAIADELNTQMQRDPLLDPARLTLPSASRSISYEWEANPGSDTSTSRYFLYVKIDVLYPYPLYIPLVGNLVDGLDGSFDGALTLRASEEMRIENPSLPLGVTPPPCP